MTESEKEVFISCVQDVRYSFVSHLSEALRQKGINVLPVDIDDLLSKEAQAYVQRARVSVMVLPGDRKVCLKKLLEVIKCQSNKDQVVFPVLFGVVSSLQNDWLAALDSLDLRGLRPVHLSREECSDSQLVQEIVRDVYEKLFYMERIGIYSKLLEIENMVRKQPPGIRCVGIWGMPGIGKTTLARAVYDQMSGGFDAHCFIEDYDNAVHAKGIYCLLEQKIKESGADWFRDKSNNKRVLVVLDDVRDPMVAESFLRRFDWFCPESLIIIISNDKQVFRLCRVDQICEVKGLNEKEALQLFLLCASIDGTGEQNLDYVVEYANGNPLALRSFGRELKGLKNPSEMHDAFLRLKQCPPPDIVDAVKRSYDTLSDNEKNIFLDIACFFKGENVDYVMQLLESCDLFPHVGVDVLVDKSLVTISENLFQMDNLIQDVGREKFNGETIDIKMPRRLWEPSWSRKYLESNEQTTSVEDLVPEKIEGIFLDTLNLSFDIKPTAFLNMLNLRLLKIYCSNPEIHPVINFSKGLLHSLPNKLRLLHWENYPLQSLPQNFDPLHLVEINMPYSQLQKLWGGTKNLETLRTIRLCHSQQLVAIDELLKAKNLEVIDLQGCTRLQNFPATGQLLHLRDVNLAGCREMKNFPDVPPNIETLHLQGTGIKNLPIVKPNGGEIVSYSEFQGLSDALILERFKSLMKSSSSCQDLGKLICLELKDCSRLKSLPNMVNLELLTVLDLSGCSELKTIHGFPRNLKELNLANTAVREVPQLPLSLELLNVHGSVSLKSINLDSKKLPMHYKFSNFFDLSPHMVNDFIVKALSNVQHIPRGYPQELNKAPTFSFCAPSHTNQNSTLDLQRGSSVMIRLYPSWRNTLVGFAMLVEVAFSEEYSDATGFGIRCVCRWNNTEGLSHRIERDLHFWAPGKAVPNVQKDHTFVFCDVKMRPSTNEGNDPNIYADLVVFEFFPVNQQAKLLNNSRKVTRCGVYDITALTGKTSLSNTSPVFSLHPMKISGDEVEDVLKIRYDGLQEMDKSLFLYMACLFNNDVDVDLVAPLIASIDLDISSGLKVLVDRSLIHMSSSGQITMHCLLQKMGKEILHRESMLPGSSKDLTRDIEKVFVKTSVFRNWKHDVFISFSGKDVRKSFLSHLFGTFDRKAITCFRDDEMSRGQPMSTICKAIRESRISIVVFTKNYGSSRWCLNELVEIAKYRDESGQIVIPIFYDVDPSHVRKQTGDFGREIEKVCEGTTVDESQRWCQALTNIAQILGYYLPMWSNEATVIEAIATDVSKKLNSTASKDFDDFVGIEHHISEVSSILCFESDSVRMVGIWGPSGIGKSTIARALYSRFARHFQHSIFVDRNLMENSRRAKLDDYGTKLQLQTQFLSELLRRKGIKISHLGVLSQFLREKKVLIILDDVDDLVLLDALVGETSWFGPGSRIVVVSKDKGLLNAHGISNIYQVNLPSKKQALQIFCRSAFGSNFPPDGFSDLVVEAAEAVGKLPLGLSVLGSSLRGRDGQDWMIILHRVKNVMSGEIERVLRVAYDRLNDSEQTLFLHIACLFNYDTVESVIRLLAKSNFDAGVELRRLADKSLIRITENGHITMYRLQQNLGREIVRRQSHEPGKRCFLVDPLDICDVLMDSTGTERILGISLDLSEINELFIKEKGFLGMRNLQFLRFYTNLGNKEVKVHLPCGLNDLSPKLRLLHWEAFPMRCMPSNFVPKDLVELVMEASKLEKLWSVAQPLGSLKCMSLRGSLNLREIPDLLYATNLERLELACCSSLTMLPSTIERLHKLKDLDMESCTYLEVLPTGINLESLNSLNLKGCSRLRSFPEISTNISDLYLDETAIEEVPLWIENFFGLSYLSMNGCKKLTKISPNISKLKLLAEVDFSECTALTEDSWQNHPDGISTSLMRVDMAGNSFKSLPDTWVSIQPKDLILNNCRNLVSLPELPASLSMLSANNCKSIESIYGSFDYPQLAIQFLNCFSLNHQARELILHSDCAYAILPGEEIPAHFDHRATENFLTISLPQSSLFKRFPTFKACMVVESRSVPFGFGVVWSFKGRSDEIYINCLTNTSFTKNHLIVFNCEFSPDKVDDSPAEPKHSDVQFAFVCLDHKKEMIKIKECGIQLLEVPPFQEGSGKNSETEYGNYSVLTKVEDTGSSSKRMRVRGDDCDKFEEEDPPILYTYKRRNKKSG